MRRPTLYFLSIALPVFLLDQWSKEWAVAMLKPLRFRSPEHTVIQNYLNFSYAQNDGATFSFLASAAEWVRLPILSLIAAIASIGIAIFYTRVRGRMLAMRTALALLWAGAVGNLVDRLRYTYVVDFIDAHYNTFTWPTFNVADVSIVTGILLFFFFGEPKKSEPKPA